MAKTIEYVEAKREYKTVKYFPFICEPGDPFVLTSDPWNYLKAWLNSEERKIKKRTDHKDRLNKAIYFAELAENFQKAADLTSLPTKGTLTYYSILNLSKVFLLARGINLEQSIEYHGLNLPSDKEVELKTSNATSGNGINIFHEFANQLNCAIQPGTFISLDEMISEIPEIHEMCFNLGKLTTKKRKFLPINIRILTDKSRKKKLAYDIELDKKNSMLMRTDKFKSGILLEHLEAVESSTDTGDKLVYISKNKWNYTHTSDSSWKSNYKHICEELDKLNISLMLTRQGYRYYLNLQPNKYKPLLYYFALMYYIGSVARYRPSLNEKILNGDYQAIINEVMTTGPKQFLYQLVSRITQKICAVPMAKID